MTATNSSSGIDPRGPRFGAAITAVLLVVAVFTGLLGVSASTGAGGFLLPSASLWDRLADPGFISLAVIAALFLWGVLSPGTHPWGGIFRGVVRPRLAAPAELEDPRPPRFAQLVGLFVVTAGLVLHLLGVPLALPVAAGAAFIAAFLNAAIGFCLGCEIYLLLTRARGVRRNIS